MLALLNVLYVLNNVYDDFKLLRPISTLTLTEFRMFLINCFV